MNRFILAFKCFFNILLSQAFFEKVLELEKPEEPKEIPEKEDTKKEDMEMYSSRLLSLLQRDGRFIDFLQEKIDEYSDAQIGAVARSLHGGCKKVMDNYITIEPVINQEEGTDVTVKKEIFDPSAIQVTGNVTGEPPFKGCLRHHGWKVTEVKLPDIAEGQDTCIIQPAELEVL